VAKRLFIPHHISGFWLPVYTDDPVTTGSVGAGVLVGGAVAVYEGVGVRYNDALLERDGGVKIASPFPLGYGYAASAVVAIAKAIGEAGLAPRAFVKAHVEEVSRRTGLGDVLAIYTGGCLVARVKAGAPGIGEAYSMPCPKVGVVTADLAQISTGHMLTSRHSVIASAGAEAVAEFLKNPSFEAFLKIALNFSKRVGFLDARMETLGKLPGVLGLFAKKGVLVVFVERDWILDVAHAVEALGKVHVETLRELRVEPLLP